MKYFLLGFALFIVGCTTSQISSPPEPSSDMDNIVGCAEIYAPVCATYQVQCFTTPCPPIKQTYDNECFARKAGAGILFKGECGEEENKPYTEKSITPQLPNGDFFSHENGGFSGNAYLWGYAEIIPIPESFCEQDCPIYQGVFINALDSSNDSFQKFLVANRGNAHIRDNKVLIGCLKDRKIFYDNYSDEFGRKNIEIPEAEAQLILATTYNSPRIFRLKKLPLSWGSETAACYSHFSEVEVLE